jgi:hypothetical protein
MDEMTIEHMRERIALCRRLASRTTDREILKALTQMADDGEADIARMEADAATPDKPNERADEKPAR